MSPFWRGVLVIIGAMMALDGLVLFFYPARIRRLLEYLSGDGVPEFLQGNRIRVLGILEMVLGLGILLSLSYLGSGT